MKEMEQDRKFWKNSDILACDLNEEKVMMSLEKGNYYLLNPCAGRLWDLLERPATVRELTACLVLEYEVEEEICHKDVREFLDQMGEQGLVLHRG